MKILIINMSDINGGAARAAYRLNASLIKIGIDSSMIVSNKYSDDFKVLGPNTKFKKAFNAIKNTIDQLPLIFYPTRTKTYFSINWLYSNNLINYINNLNPDIVHLHWINGGMLRIEDIKKIKSPIIWSLHDNWAFTGGCHIMWECDKYKLECGKCPILDSKKENDLSKKIFKRKIKSYDNINDITIVGLSRWINNCSKDSFLLKNKKHINLPNLINTSVYKRIDKEISKKIWNLPNNKKLILFGAVSAISDINKGYKELLKALNQLNIVNIEIVVFGSSEPKEKDYFKYHVNYLGHLHDDISLVTLYNAVDAMVVPSLQENLSNAIMESLSCGTPVVAFDIGGNSDLIEHKRNGYLAKAFDTIDLKDGIEWVLNNKEYEKLSENAIEKVKKEFSEEVVSIKYKELYTKILENKKLDNK